MNPVRLIKKLLYFWVASYFRFWARIFLLRWQPKIITVTGSSGKTTLLHLFKAQLQEEALYSDKANSAFGIPFHILGLERTTFKIYEWFLFIVLAPVMIFRSVPKQKIYITEADAERPGEGQFLAKLLKPHILVWLSLDEAHGINYDRLVPTSETDKKEGVKKAMAHEFGYFLDYTQGYAILNKDNAYIKKESERAKCQKIFISDNNISAFKVFEKSITLDTGTNIYSVPELIPQSAGLSVYGVVKAIELLNRTVDTAFVLFELPPGRSSVFPGKKGITIIDSTYNATIDGVRSMLELVAAYTAPGEKWLVLGDMIEQGRSEAQEHIYLAELIKKTNPARVILVGPRLKMHTYPILQKDFGQEKVVSYLMPKEALEYLERELKGGETILFKGARFLEGVVEKLLQDPQDVEKLCRRETVWANRRKEWGV